MHKQSPTKSTSPRHTINTKPPCTNSTSLNNHHQAMMAPSPPKTAPTTNKKIVSNSASPSPTHQSRDQQNGLSNLLRIPMTSGRTLSISLSLPPTVEKQTPLKSSPRTEVQQLAPKNLATQKIQGFLPDLVPSPPRASHSSIIGSTNANSPSRRFLRESSSIAKSSETLNRNFSSPGADSMAVITHANSMTSVIESEEAMMRDLLVWFSKKQVEASQSGQQDPSRGMNSMDDDAGVKRRKNTHSPRRHKKGRPLTQLERFEEFQSSYGPTDVNERELGLPPKKLSTVYFVPAWRCVFMEWVKALNEELLSLNDNLSPSAALVSGSKAKHFASRTIPVSLFLTKAHRATAVKPLMQNLDLGQQNNNTKSLITFSGRRSVSSAIPPITDIMNQQSPQHSRARRASSVSQSAQRKFLQQQKQQISQPSRRGSVAAQTIANYIRSSPHPMLTASAIFVFHEHILPLFTNPKHKRLAYEAMRELLFFAYEGTPPSSVQGLEASNDYGKVLQTLSQKVSAIPTPNNAHNCYRKEPLWRQLTVDSHGNQIDLSEYEQYVGVTNAAKFEFTRRFFVVSREVSSKKTQFMQKKAVLLSQAVIRIANQTVSRLFFAWRAYVVRTKVVKERYRNIFLAVSTTAFTKDAIRKWKVKAHGIVLKRDAAKMAQLQRVSSNVLMSLGIVKRNDEPNDEIPEGTVRLEGTNPLGATSVFSGTLTLGTSTLPTHGTATARAADAKKKLMRLKQASNALVELKQNKLRIIEQLRQGNDALLVSHKSLVKKEQRYLKGIARLGTGWQSVLDMTHPDPKGVPYFPQLVDYNGYSHLLRESSSVISHREEAVTRTKTSVNHATASPLNNKGKKMSYDMDLLRAEMVPETAEARQKDMIMWLVRAAQLDEFTAGPKLESLLLQTDVQVALVSQVQHLMPILRPLMTIFMNTSGYGALPNDNTPQADGGDRNDSNDWTESGVTPFSHTGISAQNSLQGVPSVTTLAQSAAPSLPSFTLMGVTNSSGDATKRDPYAPPASMMASSFVIPEMTFDISGGTSVPSQNVGLSPTSGGGGLLSVPGGGANSGGGSLMAGRGTKRLLSARMNQIAARVMGNEPPLTVVVPSTPSMSLAHSGGILKQHKNDEFSVQDDGNPTLTITLRRGSLKNANAVERAARSVQDEAINRTKQGADKLIKTSQQQAPPSSPSNKSYISNNFQTVSLNDAFLNLNNANPLRASLAMKLLKPFAECVDKTDFSMLLLEALNTLVFTPLESPLKALLLRTRPGASGANTNSNSQSLSTSHIQQGNNSRHLSSSVGRGGLSVSFGDGRRNIGNSFGLPVAIGHRFVPLEPNDPNIIPTASCYSSGEFSPNTSISRRAGSPTTNTQLLGAQHGSGLAFLSTILPLSLCKYISANKSEDWRRLLISVIFYSQMGPTSGAFRVISATNVNKRADHLAPSPSASTAVPLINLNATLGNESNSDYSPTTSPREGKKSIVPTATGIGLPLFDPLAMSSKVTKVGAIIHKSKIGRHTLLPDDIPSSGRDMRTFFADRVTKREDTGATTLAQSASMTYYETAQRLVSSALEVTGIIEEATSVYDMYSAASPDVYDSRIITQSFLSTKFRVIFGKDSTFWRQIVNTRSMITSPLEFQELLVTLAPGAGLTPTALCQKMLSALDDVDLFYIATSSEAVQDAFARHLTDLSVIFSLFAKGEPPNFVVDLQRWMHLSAPFFDIYFTPDLSEQIYKDTVKRFRNAGAMVVTNTIGTSGRTDYALQWRRPSAMTPIEGIGGNNTSNYLIGLPPPSTPSQPGRTPSDIHSLTPMTPSLLQGASSEKEKKRMQSLAPSHVLVPSAISLVDNDSPFHSRHGHPHANSFNSSVNHSTSMYNNNNSSSNPSSMVAASVDFHDPGLDLDGLCNALCSVASIKMPNPLVPLEQRIDKFISELLVPIVGSKVKDSRRRDTSY